MEREKPNFDILGRIDRVLFGKIYIHRVTLALIAIIHVKGDAACLLAAEYLC